MSEIGGGDKAVLWLVGLFILACVFFKGEPDLIDAIRNRIQPQPCLEVEKK